MIEEMRKDVSEHHEAGGEPHLPDTKAVEQCRELCIVVDARRANVNVGRCLWRHGGPSVECHGNRTKIGNPYIKCRTPNNTDQAVPIATAQNSGRYPPANELGRASRRSRLLPEGAYLQSHWLHLHSARGKGGTASAVYSMPCCNRADSQASAPGKMWTMRSNPSL